MPEGLIGDQPPGPGYWMASDGKWYPPPAPGGDAAQTVPVEADSPQCPNGHQVPDSATFCPVCGLARTTGEQQGSGSYCTQCGTPSKPGASFCASCGAATTTSPVAPPQQRSATPAPMREPVTGQMPVVRVAQPTRSTGPWLVVAIVAAVLVLGLAGGLVYAFVNKNSPTKVVVLPPPTHGTSSTSSTSTTSSTTSTTVAPDQQVAAQALSVLLTQSVIDRSDINSASDDATACGPNLTADAQTFDTAYNSRQSLLAQLPDLTDLSSLPPALIQALTSAWQASGQVDQDYANWANDESQYGCTASGTTDPNYQDAVAPNQEATLYKQSFCNLWNPIATKYGLPTYQYSQL